MKISARVVGEKTQVIFQAANVLISVFLILDCSFFLRLSTPDLLVKQDGWG